MKTIIVLLALLSFNAFAVEHYKCYRVPEFAGSKDETLTLSTGLFSKKIVAAELITKIKGNFEEVSSPFSEGDAAELIYKAIEKTTPGADKSTYRITLSESILNLKESGYAHYYANQCWWIMDCHQVSKYFKCDKI